MQTPYKDGLALLRKAFEKEQDEKIWQMWVAQIPRAVVQIPQIDEKSHMSYAEYRDKLLNQTKPHKEQSVDDQIAMCRLLNAAFGGEVVEL